MWPPARRGGGLTGGQVRAAGAPGILVSNTQAAQGPARIRTDRGRGNRDHHSLTLSTVWHWPPDGPAGAAAAAGNRDSDQPCIHFNSITTVTVRPGGGPAAGAITLLRDKSARASRVRGSEWQYGSRYYDHDPVTGTPESRFSAGPGGPRLIVTRTCPVTVPGANLTWRQPRLSAAARPPRRTYLNSSSQVPSPWH